MKRLKSLIVLGLLLSALVPVVAVVWAQGCGSSIFCVQSPSDSLTLSESVQVTSRVVQITEQFCYPTPSTVCVSPLQITESVSFLSAKFLTDSLHIAESMVVGPILTSVKTVTATITMFITKYANACGSGSVCTPFAYGGTSFGSTISYFIIPILTLVMFVSIALAAHVRSFTVLTLFGTVGLLMMAESAIVPPWIPFVLIIVLTGTTVRVMGSVLGSSSIYSTMMFLLLLGSFTGIYAQSAPAGATINCSVSGPNGNTTALTQQLCTNQSPTLSCIGNILGHCVVSDIINGLTSFFNLFGSITSSPVSTALTLGILFLFAGVIAGIMGFGQLMNIVFAVGLGVSMFYYSNAELSTFIGIPGIVYALFNGTIGVSELYIFWEAFRGSGGGGASSPGESGSGSGTSSSAGGGHGTGVT